MFNLSLRSSPYNASRLKKRIWNLVIHLSLMLLSVAFLFPLLLVVIVSFTDEQALDKYGYSFLPAKWSMQAYKYINEWCV